MSPFKRIYGLCERRDHRHKDYRRHTWRFADQWPDLYGRVGPMRWWISRSRVPGTIAMTRGGPVTASYYSAPHGPRHQKPARLCRRISHLAGHFQHPDYVSRRQSAGTPLDAAGWIQTRRRQLLEPRDRFGKSGSASRRCSRMALFKVHSPRLEMLIRPRANFEPFVSP